MPRSICGIATALVQNLHLIGAVNTEFKVEHRILPGIPILCAGQRNLVLGWIISGSKGEEEEVRWTPPGHLIYLTGDHLLRGNIDKVRDKLKAAGWKWPKQVSHTCWLNKQQYIIWYCSKVIWSRVTAKNKKASLCCRLHVSLLESILSEYSAHCSVAERAQVWRGGWWK